MAPMGRKLLIKGVGLAFLGRIGAVVEALSFPLFLALYGPVLFGIYATAWAAARLASGFAQMGMVLMLQQYVPLSEDDPRRSAAVLRFALTRALWAALAVVAVVTAASPWLAGAIDRAGALGPGGAELIALFAWIVPAWTLLEVLTGAIRALRRFGPEIRVRIFYEQVLRLVLGVAFALAGLHQAGLFIGHLGSALIAALLAFRLVGRHYDLGLLRRARLPISERRRLWAYTLPLMPSELIQRGFSELPVVVLNAVLPAAQGAAAAGYYAVARKIASVMQLVFNAFDYVMAPLAAHHLARAEKAQIADLHAYATRLMVAVGAVTAGALIAASDLIAMALDGSAAVVAPTLSILVLGRFVGFFFGQAQAVVRAMVSSRLVLINGIAGLSVTLAVVWALAPSHGPAGAAVGAALGIVLLHALAALELRLAAGVCGWSRALLRPLAVGLVLAAAIVLIDQVLTPELPPAALFTVLAAALLLALAALVRYGLAAEDARAFGRLARWLGRDVEE